MGENISNVLSETQFETEDVHFWTSFHKTDCSLSYCFILVSSHISYRGQFVQELCYCPPFNEVDIKNRMF